MTESTTQAHLVTHLVTEGWRIVKTADTSTKERGIDVLAVLGRRTLAVEVKGYPAKKYADPRRAAETKPTAPATEARHWYAQAVLKCMLTQGEHPDYEVAIALPDASTYRGLIARTQGSLDRLDVRIFLIASGGRITSPSGDVREPLLD